MRWMTIALLLVASACKPEALGSDTDGLVGDTDVVVGTDPDTDSPPADSDGDGVADVEDNCVLTANADQADRNEDGQGDACADQCEAGATESDPGCDGVCDDGEAGTVDCDSVCGDGDAGTTDCNNACEPGEGADSADCDAVCGAEDAADSVDCDGLCGPEDTGTDCNEVCDPNESGSDCDGVCGPGDVAPDCDGVCSVDEAGTQDCDGVCADGDMAPDCDGTCDAGETFPDCDGTCDPDETGSDCDGVCRPEEAGSIDCDGVCTGRDTAPDCDGICDVGDTFPDCDGVCDPEEAGDDCDGFCDVGDSPQDCDGVCDEGEDPEGDDCRCDCPDGFEARPAGDGCVQYIESDPTDGGGERFDVCAIETLSVYGNSGARFPGNTVDTSSFWMGSSWPEQRMNQVGVWTCRDVADSVSDHAPINEWIGFSICIDLPEPGLYVVGSGGDNLIRMSIDGDSVYESPSVTTAAFNVWWLRTRVLSSGTHSVEMEGRNTGGPGGFGAEIYGPFPEDTPLDDASLQALDFAGNVAWSSVDTIGGQFVLGEGNSGLSCSDGSAVDVCEVDPVCIDEVSAECLDPRAE